MIKTLIVDDSSLVRAIIRDFLESDGSFEITGEAENGLDGLTKALQLKPDLITMDIEMPVMNGLEAIGEIKKQLDAAIVVISTHDTAKMALDAVVKGAMEFFPKDIFTSQISAIQRENILNTIKHITGIRKKNILITKNEHSSLMQLRRIKCVVIASSTGGPIALCKLCEQLPGEFPVPIIIVQHNSSGFDRGFVQWLDGYSHLNVLLAQEGMIPVRGNIYIAPTDKHLVLDKACFAFDDSESVNNQKPAADLLFKSAAALYGESLVSVVLTGMGCDGADGTRYVKQAGGLTVSQDEASSMIYGMPLAAAQTGCVDMVLPLDEIANQLILITKGNI